MFFDSNVRIRKEIYLSDIIRWTNENSGFLTLLLFLVTLFFGWISGIFKHLRHRPNFILNLIPGPTFCCTFNTGRKYESYDSKRTAIVIYLTIKNIGSASSQIEKIQVGYHNHTFKYSFLWFWLNTTISLKDFGHTMGDNLRHYPFLIQKSILLPQNNVTYLKNGQSTSGIVYFEQPESYGGFVPRVKNGKVKINVKVYDIYNKSYTKTFWIPIVDLDYAKKFNEEFGQSLEKIEHGEIEEWKVF